MGRRENPLDPTAGPVERFAYELRELRGTAGRPTYRTMAGRVAYAAATLSEAASGDRLPSLPVALAYARACGGDEAEWERRWRAAAAACTLSPRQEDGESPYLGLTRFEPADRDKFFGREQLVADLVGLVRDRRFAVLVGASGSGKSSLLRAGLIPVLRRAEPAADRPATVRILTPGAQPCRTHAAALTPAGRAGDTYVIVDQFEEAFTLCQDREERDRFLDALLSAVEPDSRVRVVVSLRSDFYGRLAEHVDLADAVRETTLLVGPMRREELRAAIVKPAATQGLIIQRSLTARVIADVDGEPGCLPLMSHALRETWRRRRGRTLTLTDYEGTGGVHGAIAHTAELLYTRLSASQAALARQLLLRLINPGESAQDTRRPAPRRELDMGDPADTGHVLDRLARARLITVDEGTVELAHEALVTAWPRLRSWIDQDRQRLRTHRRLTEAAASWQELDRDPGALYRGSRLAAAEDAFPPERHEQLTALERAFLTTSRETRHHERRVATRTTRRLRALTGTLSLLLVFSLVATVVAIHQQRNASAAERMARSRQLAAQSSALIASDPDLAALLAVEAYRTSPTTEATSSLYTAAALPLRHRLAGHGEPVHDLAFSRDGGTLVTTGEDGTLRRWDTATGEPLGTARVRAQGEAPYSVLSPDGVTFAATGPDEAVHLGDVVTGEASTPLAAPGGGAWPLAFTPDGTALAALVSGEAAVRLFDAATGEPLDTPGLPVTWGVVELFGPNGGTLAGASADGVRIWDTTSGRVRTTLDVPTDQLSGIPGALSFSPDGRALAVAGTPATIGIHDAESGRLLRTLDNPRGEVAELAFSPDGATLAAAGSDGEIRLWDVATGRTLTTLTGHTDAVRTVAFSPDGALLATAGDDGTARLWNVPVGRVTAMPGIGHAISTAAFSPDAATLATAGDDGLLRLWDVATGRPRTALVGYSGFVTSAAFSSDGTTVVTLSKGGVTRLWDTRTGRLRESVPLDVLPNTAALSPDGSVIAMAREERKVVQIFDRETYWVRLTLDHPTAVRVLAFSPDGATLATAGDDGVTRLWDAGTGRPRALLPDQGDRVQALAFSPDGATLATAGDDGTIRLWDVSTGRTRTALTGHTGTVRSLVFNRESTALTAVEGNGTLRRWRFTLPGAAEAGRAICGSVRRDLTAEERSLYLPDAPTNPVCPRD
ncbi:hypothetical protein [Streptomyces hainanensis]|uniref:HTH cro/C1-type domain-containing protein n=1 Tax=Streptomyces hainanensis TaxID=402648 RepID=A0A4R4TMB3_9ACTN|nr:hypothetical protein [Streptomyces hainanensis]TDC78970.1 hypothetical protein E1283_03840 [Streptomyces hainanensis]